MVEEILAALPPATRAAIEAADARGRGAGPAARGELAPKSCPHCGALAAAPGGGGKLDRGGADAAQARAAGGAAVAVLTCGDCGARWLNVPQDKLQLGTTVLLERRGQRPLGSLGGGSGSGSAGSSNSAGGSGDGAPSDTAAVAWQPAKRTAVAVHDAPRGGGVGRLASGGEGAAARALAAAAPPPAGAPPQPAPPPLPPPPTTTATDDLNAAAGAAATALPMWPSVTPRDVYRVITEATGIPTEHLGAGASATLASLAQQLSRSVIGQGAAVAAAAAAVQVARLGLQPDSSPRPAASLLLLGPDGVGKSTLARALGGALLPSEPAACLVLSMGDYSERHSAARLVGAPPG